MDTALVAILVLLSIGIILIVQPRKCAEVLGKFYSRYPLIRLAGDAQFQLQISYVVVLGLVILCAGCFALYQLLMK